MNVSEGPESTPQIPSNANPQTKFPREFLLNPDWNPVASQDPFGQSKQPTLNIPSGSQVHVGNEKQVDGGRQKRPLENVTRSGLSKGNPRLTPHQNMAPKGDELYASSPLFQKEKVTVRHHPYSSKARKGHSSSSRETIFDDEQRDDFTVHEKGTQSNSEFTHPQMALSQSMLQKSKMRQQRIQAHKAHCEPLRYDHIPKKVTRNI
ncbi:hypothetical protein O181_086759 [Austropuccinia psidii MF-1]|uniref:Uncharacterized protein n=1 Tax=Austropuccinia psidii MF-1 TaxID=1389203 RepID=A0A9Q3ING1_9BASI|nr:hypothetical protein [Austropuccinia psidii MF-1]